MILRTGETVGEKRLNNFFGKATGGTYLMGKVCRAWVF